MDCSLLGELVNRLQNENLKENLKNLYSKDPQLFDADFVKLLYNLYKTQTITFKNFDDLAKLASVQTFQYFANNTDSDKNADYDNIFSTYFNAIGNKYTVNPKQFKDRILSLLKLKIQINDNSSINHISMAKVEYKSVIDNKKPMISNVLDLFNSYSYEKTFNASTPVAIMFSTTATKINMSGPILSKLITHLIQYEQSIQDTAFSVDKEIAPFIKNVPLLERKIITRKDDSDSDSS